MKNYIKLISLALAVIMITGLCSACGLLSPTGTQKSDPPFAAGGSDNNKAPNKDGTPDKDRAPDNTQGDDSEVDFETDMIPMVGTPPVPIVLTPVASGTLVESNNKVGIDYSNNVDGYIMVEWKTATDKQLRVQISGPEGASYNYRLRSDGIFEVYPLSDGSGEYTVIALEQTDGTKYSVVATAKFSVTLVDEFAPFLHPNQFVNFDEDSKVVAKASELMTGKDDLLDRIAAVFNFIIGNLTYDTVLAENVQSGYVPDLDAILASGKGICFDYASVMTAMLRSQGIPTKLVFGYAGEAYHAWINVYSEEEGWINAVIFFDGESWMLMDPTFESSAGNSSALRAFIGDGSNYTVKHLF